MKAVVLLVVVLALVSVRGDEKDHHRPRPPPVDPSLPPPTCPPASNQNTVGPSPWRDLSAGNATCVNNTTPQELGTLFKVRDGQAAALLGVRFYNCDAQRRRTVSIWACANDNCTMTDAAPLATRTIRPVNGTNFVFFEDPVCVSAGDRFIVSFGTRDLPFLETEDFSDTAAYATAQQNPTLRLQTGVRRTAPNTWAASTSYFYVDPIYTSINCNFPPTFQPALNETIECGAPFNPTAVDSTGCPANVTSNRTALGFCTEDNVVGFWNVTASAAEGSVLDQCCRYPAVAEADVLIVDTTAPPTPTGGFVLASDPTGRRACSLNRKRQDGKTFEFQCDTAANDTDPSCDINTLEEPTVTLNITAFRQKRYNHRNRCEKREISITVPCGQLVKFDFEARPDSRDNKHGKHRPDCPSSHSKIVEYRDDLIIIHATEVDATITVSDACGNESTGCDPRRVPE